MRGQGLPGTQEVRRRLRGDRAQGRAWRGIASAEQLAVVAVQPRCAQCGDAIPRRKRADAHYCSRACKANAARARRAAHDAINDAYPAR
ncbi:hypothetical protein ACTWPT_31405 [Nonomuraea sp. 3N208]|uniref:hypothetical protein n=1 Tax=Nonomuraea sp. 3N208 TaxID=3457421 RepID=UPI003FCFE7F3